MACLALVLCAAPVHAATVLKTTHFILYSNSRSPRLAEDSLARLEELRAALISLHGESWIAERPQQIWIPASEAEWRSVAENSNEAGRYISGLRKDWIVFNPKSADSLEVLSHEYVHGVLHHVLPNIPTWFAEGICEYYSTLDFGDKGKRGGIEVGRVPRSRLELLRLGGWRFEELDAPKLGVQQYAVAWAAVHVLAGRPGWGDFLKLRIDPENFWSLAAKQLGVSKEKLVQELRSAATEFAVRKTGRKAERMKLEYAAVSPAEVAELESNYRGQVPSIALPTQEGEAADEATQIFLKGLKLADDGKSAEAIELLESACKLAPSNSSWWHTLELAYRDLGQLDKARVAVGKALDTAASETESGAAKALMQGLK